MFAQFLAVSNSLQYVFLMIQKLQTLALQNVSLRIRLVLVLYNNNAYTVIISISILDEIELQCKE